MAESVPLPSLRPCCLAGDEPSPGFGDVQIALQMFETQLCQTVVSSERLARRWRARPTTYSTGNSPPWQRVADALNKAAATGIPWIASTAEVSVAVTRLL